MEIIKITKSLHLEDIINNCCLLFNKEGEFMGSLRVDNDTDIMLLACGPDDISECHTINIEDIDTELDGYTVVTCSFAKMKTIMQKVFLNSCN